MWMDLYYQQQQPLFYSRNTGQLAPPVKNWRIFFGAKFYCLHALADGSQRIRIKEKTLESSPQQCYLHCLHTGPVLSAAIVCFLMKHGVEVTGMSTTVAVCVCV